MSGIYELLYNPKFTPRRSPGSHIDEMIVDGESAFVLANETTGEYYEVDGKTNAIWNLLDGTRTVKDVIEEARKADETLTEKGVRQLIVSLAEEGTIESTEPEVDKSRIESASAFQLNIHLVRDSSKSLARFFRVTRRLIRKEELPIALAISAVGAILFAGTFAHLFSNSSVFAIAGSTLLGYLFYQLVVLLPVYAVHELAHAVACDHYGGKPKGLGTGLYYLAPFFYCDTSDSWRLPTRARIMISVAGPLSTIVIASLFVFVSYFIPAGFERNFLQIAAFFCFYGTLLNLSPVLETDGYYILADIVKIPNLRDESFAYVKRVFRHLLGKRARAGRGAAAVRLGGRRGQIFLLYGLISIAWLLVWGITSLQLFSIYGRDAYSSVVSLASTILRDRVFNVTTVGVDVATLSYFALLLAGLGVMGGGGVPEAARQRSEARDDSRQEGVCLPSAPYFSPAAASRGARSRDEESSAQVHSFLLGDLGAPALRCRAQPGKGR
jgi:hypothetical protein